MATSLDGQVTGAFRRPWIRVGAVLAVAASYGVVAAVWRRNEYADDIFKPRW